MKLFVLLAVLLTAAHLCHVAILWEGDTLPLASAQQMLRGKTLYRDIWFDKPPLLPAFDLIFGARAGWPLRLAGALYALLACWIAYRFARDLWSEREGLWAAGLLGFFLIFDFPATVLPVASDLLMLAPHIAAVWLAWRKRPFWAGLMAGVAFWISPKGLFVLAACALWNPAGSGWIAAGFVSASAIVAATLWAAGALGSYWDEVWRWGRLYAASTFVAAPVRNGLVRT
ncbi:MAG TPA: glycosyltransferase family 39 protein, partial [Bryobacteraceae bacterium]